MNRSQQYRLRKSLMRISFYFVVALIVLYTIFPFYWAIVSSLKSGSAIFTTELWPAHPSIKNYYSIFLEQPFGHNILNSVIVAVTTVIVSLFISVTAAYALSRIEFKGRGLLLMAILSASMFPQVAVLSGMFELIHALGLYNTHLGLMLSYLLIVLPFTVWILTTFMRALPKEIEEAAIMDGATPWVIITRIFLPLLTPVLFTTGILAFIAAWNEFLFALTFMISNNMRTVPVAIALMTGNSQFELPWGNIMAASVVVTLPLVLLVLFFQKYIISGLTTGAVKG
jgi:trehalose/maltose transport system permease protein